jgi:hypothetical protein
MPNQAALPTGGATCKIPTYKIRSFYVRSLAHQRTRQKESILSDVLVDRATWKASDFAESWHIKE